MKRLVPVIILALGSVSAHRPVMFDPYDEAATFRYMAVEARPYYDAAHAPNPAEAETPFSHEVFQRCDLARARFAIAASEYTGTPVYWKARYFGPSTGLHPYYISAGHRQIVPLAALLPRQYSEGPVHVWVSCLWIEPGVVAMDSFPGTGRDETFVLEGRIHRISQRLDPMGDVDVIITLEDCRRGTDPEGPTGLLRQWFINRVLAEVWDDKEGVLLP